MIEHKDLLGKTLRIGQIAVNIFPRDKKHKGEFGESIQHRLCKIIKINSSGVRIEYQNKDGETGQSNIYNTANRLIILKKKDNPTPINNKNNIINNRWEILDL